MVSVLRERQTLKLVWERQTLVWELQKLVWERSPDRDSEGLDRINWRIAV